MTSTKIFVLEKVRVKERWVERERAQARMMSDGEIKRGKDRNMRKGGGISERVRGKRGYL